MLGFRRFAAAQMAASSTKQLQMTRVDPQFYSKVPTKDKPGLDMLETFLHPARTPIGQAYTISTNPKKQK